MSGEKLTFVTVVAICAFFIGRHWYGSWRQLRRAEYIRNYRWPPACSTR